MKSICSQGNCDVGSFSSNSSEECLKMTADYSGYWKMISNENFEEYLKALDCHPVKPDKDITQDGDHFIIKTLSTFRNYNMDFVVGQEFEEDLSGVDDRKCMTTITWDGDRLVCVQKGEIEGRGWTHWIEGDELHLVGHYCVEKEHFKGTFPC
uniref:Retinol binding protein 1 n=1 Tax=Cyprinus carpio carpio TaxID=630221 RepID=A0A9J8DHM6_CYPCA